MAQAEMKNALNLAVGVLGTKLAFVLADAQTAAAIFAGFGTGVWMLTQAVLAILSRRR